MEESLYVVFFILRSGEGLTSINNNNRVWQNGESSLRPLAAKTQLINKLEKTRNNIIIVKHLLKYHTNTTKFLN